MPHTARTLFNANSHGAGAKATNPVTSEGPTQELHTFHIRAFHVGMFGTEPDF